MPKVLMVATSHDRFEGTHPHPTGVWLEEFAVPYIELMKHNVEITIASPKGGEMPIDLLLPANLSSVFWAKAT